MPKTYSLVYTSVRHLEIAKVVQLWNERAGSDDYEWIIAVDKGDSASEQAAKTTGAKVVINAGPKTCVAGWNCAAAASSGNVLIAVADDFVPPDKWIPKLNALEPKDWQQKDHIVHTEDGYVHNIAVLAILTRKRYDRFGYLFYPDYHSLFCDTEFTEVAYREKRVIQAKHLLFEHEHPDCQKRERDAVDLVHASKERWDLGEKLFNFRKRKNFPVDAGPNAKPEPKTTPGLSFCVYIQVTKDDLCLFEVCQRMIEEGVKDFFFSVPDEYWSGRPTPHEHIKEVRQVAAQVSQIGGRVHFLIHRVKSYRWPGDSRIRVETRVRNDALAAIKEQGFEHILIVDSDELWRRGTLKFVETLIDKHHPTAINCLMVPVVGFPGYPIDGATDVAVIYVNSSVPFKECRTPVGDQFRIQMPLVIHFSGTRRTMEETIQKHKDSGHYDDPDYDFKEFLQNVLPNIKPGFVHTYPNGVKGIHFYKKYQIWSSVRHWLADEIKEIPMSLWPFLGGLKDQADTTADRAQTPK